VDTSSHTVGEPTPAALGGPGIGAALKRVLLAARPKFFTASVLPVLVGTAWAGAHHEFDGLWFTLALLATVLAHAATNVYNDVSDDANGTDVTNVDRIFPYTGGSRFIQNGVLSRQAMTNVALAFAVAAVVAGALLTWLRGIGVLELGFVGLALGYLYSTPGVQLSGRGAGELACAVGLGALPVVGSAWLQTGRVDAGIGLVSVMVSVWVALILLINEVPDLAADAGAGKRTLVVRLGVGGARVLYRLLTLLALGAAAALVWRHDLPRWSIAPALLLAAAGFVAARGISLEPQQRAGLKKSIEMTLAIHTLGCVVLIAVIMALRIL